MLLYNFLCDVFTVENKEATTSGELSGNPSVPFVDLLNRNNDAANTNSGTLSARTHTTDRGWKAAIRQDAVDLPNTASSTSKQSSAWSAWRSEEW